MGPLSGDIIYLSTVTDNQHYAKYAACLLHLFKTNYCTPLYLVIKMEGGIKI